MFTTTQTSDDSSGEDPFKENSHCACSPRLEREPMKNRTLIALAFIGAIQAVAGCNSRTTPSAPSSVSTPTPAPISELVTFADPRSGFRTSDLRDAHEQVVRFTAAHELIWIADGTRLPGFSVQGNSISVPACACSLVVRFGSLEGDRRAYLTADYIHDNPGTLVGLSIYGGALTISPTSVFAPGTYTLYGAITETSENGPRPVAGAGVWRLNEEGSGWQVATTGKDGSYEMHGLYDGERAVSLIKEGYVTSTRVVLISGDTRFDQQIEKR
jgi:hypothetical protein